ncbi:hypothetical protein [Winogradskyella luteola]|uniref:Class I SAM-dependent methyltransferase n=1 Tax=Winogradskyella luteola TaxID=2828330 RepID=A0A9X1FAZ4_9FLAO|nr:hypothetical protein [Winogradskyella luteola]MBV7270306.1 hypothetical protein [Winogradskyella luteola]
MKRIQLFEFEDFIWFPSSIRTGMTNLLVVLQKIMRTSDIIASLIITAKQRNNFSQIIDLGSGSGGIMLDVIKKLNINNTESLKLLLTDLHPNSKLVEQINSTKIHNVTYNKSSVDATNLSNLPMGLKTMVNSFHHMPPNVAKSILKSAQDNKHPLLIYEIGENTIPTLLWWLLLPLSLAILFVMALLMTPFIKPLSWKQLVFTYLIPIIPLCYAWDGQASIMRIYTFKDIECLIKDFKNESYIWKVDKAKKPNGKKAGYYILGLPK